MMYKKICILLTLMAVSNVVLAADCKKLFTKLDAQHYAVSGKDRIKKIIKLENDLFKAIEQCKTYSGMFVLMGEVQIDMGQVPLAVVYGRKSVELDNNYWRAHKLLGSAQMLNKSPVHGLHSLQKAVELNTTNINTKLNLCSALVQNKKYDEAMLLIEKIIVLNDKDTLATAYYLRGQAYKGKGLIIQADNDIKLAQELGFEIEQR